MQGDSRFIRTLQLRNLLSLWRHLRTHDNRNRPSGAEEDQVHLMIHCMETWFLADVSALEEFLGSGFRSSAIPQRSDIENISKSDVLGR